MEFLGIWIAAFLTLCIMSFLYRDNPFFRFAESLFAGVSLGYYIGQEADQTIRPNLVIPLFTDFRGNADLLIPLLIGVNLYTRYIPKVNWWARWSLAIYVGYFVGVNMVQKLHGEVLPQMQSTIVPFAPGSAGSGGMGALLFLPVLLALAPAIWLAVKGRVTLAAGLFTGVWIVLRLGAWFAGSEGAETALDNLLLFVGVLSILVYFFFSVEHRGAIGAASRLGIWFLMLGFGAAFGYTVMGRVSLLIGRMNFLINQWGLGTLHRWGIL